MVSRKTRGQTQTGAGTSLEQTEITKTVSEFIQDNFVFDEETHIDPENSLLDSGLIDSTGVLELVNFLEDTFHFSIEDDELVPANLDSVDRITSFVSRKLNL
jgi:acyl carrier protein